MTQRQILFVVFGLMAGMFLSSLDQTIVSTAIRTIGDDLHGLDQQAWVTTAYLITSTIMVPIYGKLSDIFGRRPIYMFGIIVFVLGSLLSSFSTSMIMLAVFRGVQGIGAGALMSIPLAIMGDMLAPRERAKYQGYFMAVFGVSSVIGPLIGGMFAGAKTILFTDGWRWVFLLNVPIGIIAIIMVSVFLHLPKVADGHAKPRIDWWGAAAVVVALIPLLLVAEEGREWGWTSVASIVCYILSAIGIVSFLFIENHMGKDAIIPLHLFDSTSFSMTTLISLFQGFGMFGAMMTLPLYMQIVLGLDPTESGFAMLPMVLGLMVSSISSGQFVARTGKYRYFPTVGLFLIAVGYSVLTFLKSDSPVWFLVICMVTIGLGLGMMMQSLTLAAQSSVDAKDMGVASSTTTFFRQIGSTLGAAVLLSVLFSVMPGNVQKSMADHDELTTALSAALDPAVAAKPQNAGVMDTIWNPIVTPIKDTVAAGLETATDKVTAGVKEAVTTQVTAAVDQQVTAGVIPAAQAQAVIDQQVASALPKATEQAMSAAAEKAGVSVVDGKLAVDYSDEAQRSAVVEKVEPTMEEKITGRDAADGGVSMSDTSFLTGADRALTEPFLDGFTQSAVTVYWVGLIVVICGFILSLFFRPPALRRTSALEERVKRVEDAPAADQATQVKEGALV